MTEREIFFEALEMTTPEARAAYLQGACRGDVTLRRKVDELLKEHFSNDSLLAGPALEEERTAVAESPAGEAPAQMLGRYKLLEKIGEGGFGEVWMAEQREPVKRRVALKIIKLGMDSRQIVARFEAERQALAMMDHTNIARIFDADVTEAGRPYFVMELVRGVKITDYCDQHQLPTRERLRLFILVCHAIQHAHQKGIIHRDIKPSNILVTLHDGVPVPKVIDFGIAKATQQELTDKTVFTQFQQFIGTPAYISPEQAEMSGLDIDTRADIYSLGVLLYELLVSQTPFDAKEMMQGGIDALRQIIREREPLRPSTKLNTLVGEARTTAGKRRQTDVGKLVHQLQGDLDWIAMKCLEKDRTRRYDTANDIAADIQRHLDNEPVTARPPSAAYRFQKSVRRNKIAFVAGTAVALALVFGGMASTWQAVRARKAERAATLERNRAEQQAQLAAAEATRATAVATAARRYAYAAEINVAFQALAESNLGRVRELLDRQQPMSGEEDLRGFEWRYLWQLCHGDEIATFRDEGANAAAFSPDGKLFAYSGNKIIVRETASRKVIATLDSVASTLSFAPGGKMLASSHESGVKVWDAENWAELRSLAGTMHPARFSSDGRWLVTGVAGGFRLWDTQTWEAAGTCPGAPTFHLQSRNAVAFSPDSQFLVTIASAGHASGDHLRVWRLPGLEELPSLLSETEPPGSVAFSVDGKHVIAGLWDGRIVVWEFASRKVVATRKEHTGSVTAVAVAPDGKTFVTASADRTVNLWDAATFQHLVRLRGHVAEVGSVAMSPDGRTVMSGSADGTTKLWSAETRHPETVLDGYYLVAGFIGGGRQLLAARIDRACLWTPESGARVEYRIPNDPPFVLTAQGKVYDVKPDEPLVALGRSDGSVEVWNTNGAKIITWQAHADTIGAVAFSSDGRRLATGMTKGEVKIWDFATRREGARFDPMDRPLVCLAFSPDGKSLAGSGHSSEVWLWDAVTGRQVLKLPGHGILVFSVAFSPDGKLLATSSTDNHARLWELPSGNLRATLKGHVQAITGVVFSPDGKTLVTCGMDRKVKLWNVATHQELATFPLGGMFPTLGISPDGRTLAVGSFLEARIQILRAPSFEEIAAAQAKPRDALIP